MLPRHLKYWMPGIFALLVFGALASGCNHRDTRLGGAVGVVRFEGPIPERRPATVDGDAFCDACNRTTPMLNENWVVDPQTRGVQNAFVWVRSGLLAVDYTAPTTPVEMRLDGCRYAPHLVGAMVGQPVRIATQDATLHTVHWVARTGVGGDNWTLRPERPVEIQPRHTGIGQRLKCDIHAWEMGYLCVVDNPHYAVTAADGSFDLGALPPGEYTLGLWHEDAPSQEQAVTVRPGEPIQVNFTLTKR